MCGPEVRESGLRQFFTTHILAFMIVQLHCYRSGFIALVPQFLPCKHETCLHSVQCAISNSGRTKSRVAFGDFTVVSTQGRNQHSNWICGLQNTLHAPLNTPTHIPRPPHHSTTWQFSCPAIKDDTRTLTSTSALHPRTTEMMSILERAGSRGNSTMLRPSGVSDPVLSSAPSTHSWYMEFMMLSCNTVSTVTTQSAW